MSVYLSNTFQSKHGNSCHTYCHAHNRNCFASILFLLYALVATSVASPRAVRCFWHLVKLPSVAVKTFVGGGGGTPCAVATFWPTCNFHCVRREHKTFSPQHKKLLYVLWLCSAAVGHFVYCSAEYCRSIVSIVLLDISFKRFCCLKSPDSAAYLFSKQKQWQFYDNVKHIQTLLICSVVNYFNCTKEYGIIGSALINATTQPAITN